MDINRLIDTGIAPAMRELSTMGIPDTQAARRFLVAIALQESRVMYRRQLTPDGRQNGPAVSYWQFERGGGCVGVLTHKSVSDRMKKICAEYDIEQNAQSLWEAMRYNDIVAACAARLLIFTLPSSLPLTAEQGWNQYISAWRPGKPHASTWAKYWQIATEVTR